MKTMYKTSLEKWQRNYFQVQGDRLTTEFPRQQRSEEWVPVSLAEIRKEVNSGINKRLEKETSEISIDLTKIINKNWESKLNFLSGPPGIGKSSLLDYVVLSWAEDRFFNGETGCKFEVVLRLKCCDLVRYRGQKITKEELFEKTFGKKAYTSLLENVDPKDVLIILDGIDEFYAVAKLFTDKVDDEMSHLVEDLIKPDSALSPGHYVLVSGRPYAVQILEEKAGKIGKGKRVEIQGFTSDGIEAFIRKFARADHDLNKYVTDRIKESVALRICSEIPLFLHNICYILKAEKEQCETFQLETVTDIYTMSLCLMIKFHCKIGSLDLSDMELHKLLKDENIKTFLERITCIAWSLLKENRVFLDDKEVKEIGECHPNIQALIEGFFFKIPNELEEIFQFVHLNMQEYLAAIHCVKSNVDPQDLLDGRHYEVLKFMAGFLRVAAKSNGSSQGLLDLIHYELLKFIATLMGIEIRPKLDKRENRKKISPQNKLKSLLLSEKSIDESRIEVHAKVVFQEYKRIYWGDPCPAPLQELFLSTMFELFDQSAVLPAFIEFSDKVFRVWINSELHLRMFINFCQMMANDNRRYILCGLDVTIERLGINDAALLQGLLDSILSCYRISFHRCVIKAQFDPDLNEKVESRIQGKDFYLMQLEVIGCEISPEFRRLAATLIPSVRVVLLGFQRPDLNVFVGEIREAIEISTKRSDPARPLNLKRVHLRGRCFHSGCETIFINFCDICMQANIEEIIKLIPLIEVFRITELYLSAAEVELISASIVESATAKKLRLKVLSVIDCYLRPSEDIVKLAPAIPYIEVIDLRGYWLEFKHYAVLVKDVTKQSSTIWMIGDTDIRGETKVVELLFHLKGITHETHYINVVHDCEMDVVPSSSIVYGKVRSFIFSKDD